MLDRQNDDLAALMDHLEIPGAVICGVSYGGVFTFHFALRHPDRVAGLVAVDSFSNTNPPGLMDRLVALSNYNVWAYYLPPSWLRASSLPIWRGHEAVLQRLSIMQANHTAQLVAERQRAQATRILTAVSGAIASGECRTDLTAADIAFAYQALVGQRGGMLLTSDQAVDATAEAARLMDLLWRGVDA